MAQSFAGQPTVRSSLQENGKPAAVDSADTEQLVGPIRWRLSYTV
ncbi:hypothetical protein RBSH_01207 [Rhodopirellula baltica SH28]|uniref:Uncharacterized protein n=1 Tax=Rhodopirellula baltica SH28 TaxID=993517 RepID=K5DLW7_RHOBT|nr:hypothetical protein RBSH_01207 [Rhodopirellula baltica SH28]